MKATLPALAVASFYHFTSSSSSSSSSSTAFAFLHGSMSPPTNHRRGDGASSPPPDIASGRTRRTPCAIECDDAARRPPPSSSVVSMGTISSSSSSSSASSNSYSHSSPSAVMAMADVERRAANAIATWSVEATPFMEPECADFVETMLRERADVTAHRVVGGGRRSSPSSPYSYSSSSSSGGDEGGHSIIGEGRRSRFVLTHPDLGYDGITAESEYSSVVRMDNVDRASSNAIPDALTSIGIDLDYVGDVVVIASSSAPSHDDGAVYLVIDPIIASRRFLRLLSGEMRGVGICASFCEPNAFVPHGTIVEMKLSKSLERRLGRKRHEGGYVSFSVGE